MTAWFGYLPNDVGVADLSIVGSLDATRDGWAEGALEGAFVFGTGKSVGF